MITRREWGGDYLLTAEETDTEDKTTVQTLGGRTNIIMSMAWPKCECGGIVDAGECAKCGKPEKAQEVTP